MLYGSTEYIYAAPFANALVVDPLFRAWVLGRTKFALWSAEARLLHEEMQAQRSGVSKTWWRSHFTEKCRCAGCSGHETDILAVFERADEIRFAMHFEVKHPADRFPIGKDQAGNYALRAKCWAASAPRAVVSHSDADTALLCSASKLQEYASHLPKFGSVITFEDIVADFPQVGMPV